MSRAALAVVLVLAIAGVTWCEARASPVTGAGDVLGPPRTRRRAPTAAATTAPAPREPAPIALPAPPFDEWCDPEAAAPARAHAPHDGQHPHSAESSRATTTGSRRRARDLELADPVARARPPTIDERPLETLIHAPRRGSLGIYGGRYLRVAGRRRCAHAPDLHAWLHSPSDRANHMRDVFSDADYADSDRAEGRLGRAGGLDPLLRQPSRDRTQPTPAITRAYVSARSISSAARSSGGRARSSRARGTSSCWATSSSRGYGMTREPDFVHVIDAGTGRVLQSIPVPERTGAPRDEGRSVWVACYDAEVELRRRTLTPGQGRLHGRAGSELDAHAGIALSAGPAAEFARAICPAGNAVLLARAPSRRGARRASSSLADRLGGRLRDVSRGTPSSAFASSASSVPSSPLRAGVVSASMMRPRAPTFRIVPMTPFRGPSCASSACSRSARTSDAVAGDAQRDAERRAAGEERGELLHLLLARVVDACASPGRKPIGFGASDRRRRRGGSTAPTIFSGDMSVPMSARTSAPGDDRRRVATAAPFSSTVHRDGEVDVALPVAHERDRDRQRDAELLEHDVLPAAAREIEVGQRQVASWCRTSGRRSSRLRRDEELRRARCCSGDAPVTYGLNGREREVLHDDRRRRSSS